jgi:hypothetical protein
MALVPSDIEKIKRSQFLKFLDVTPSSNDESWKVIGIGIDEANIRLG